MMLRFLCSVSHGSELRSLLLSSKKEGSREREGKGEYGWRSREREKEGLSCIMFLLFYFRPFWSWVYNLTVISSTYFISGACLFRNWYCLKNRTTLIVLARGSVAVGLWRVWVDGVDIVYVIFVNESINWGYGRENFMESITTLKYVFEFCYLIMMFSRKSKS